MSINTDNFERQLTAIISSFSDQELPPHLPSWIQNLGIQNNNRIVKAERTGQSGSKTDIIVYFDNQKILKISAKMSSADYFGNWYSHQRLVNEFGADSFRKLSKDCAQWANNWVNNVNAKLFVGVSVCFGKRTGNTSRSFLEVFNPNDVIKIVAGVGTGNDTANCLYSTSKLPNTLRELFQLLKPINSSTIYDLSQNFKIVYRPINPLTEGSNRGKCAYAQFVPSQALAEHTEISTLTELKKLGKFEVVSANNLNHNGILNELKDNFNIVIPRKA